MPGLISEEDIRQIREMSDLVEVVSEYVTLKKKGRLHWGRCPFHNEKTPSFKVDGALQLWHCFGCGEGGNVFSFLMKIEHMEFPEAVETLARRANVEITRTVAKSPSALRREKLFEVNEAAAEHYAVLLRRGKDAENARTYLAGRGFHIEVAAEFNIGYAPAARDALVGHLLEKGFSEETIVAAGLGMRDGRLKDRFFDRIIFPIRDLKGRVVGFGGRALGEGGPKYLNSPETPVYHKSETLYALHKAKSQIVSRGRALVVEGYTDVISLHAAGFTNTVATCGTALTPEHVRLLARFTTEVVLVFDADAAGMAAAERGLAFLSSSDNLAISVAVLPEGMDPAEYVSHAGAGEFEKRLEESLGLVEFVIERRLSGHDLSSSKGRLAGVREALSLVVGLPEVARDEAVDFIAGKANVDAHSVRVELKRYRPKRTKGAGRAEAEAHSPVEGGVREKAERELLGLAFRNARYVEWIDRQGGAELLGSEDHRELYGVLSEVSEGKRRRTGGELLEELSGRMQSLASGLLLDTSTVEDEDAYCREILARLKEFEVARQIDTLKRQIERVNRLKDERTYDSLFDELIKLEARRRELQDEARGGTVVAD